MGTVSPELWRTLGVVVGVVLGSAWFVAMTWTVGYLARRDAERRDAGCPPPASYTHECTHDLSDALSTRSGAQENLTDDPPRREDV